MATGKVNWFDSGKAFGFLTPDDGGKDIFVHVTELEKNGLDGLTTGQAVKFDVGKDRRGRPCAVNVHLA